MRRETSLMQKYASKREREVKEVLKLEDRDELKILAKQLKATSETRNEALRTAEREQPPCAPPTVNV